MRALIVEVDGAFGIGWQFVHSSQFCLAIALTPTLSRAAGEGAKQASIHQIYSSSSVENAPYDVCVFMVRHAHLERRLHPHTVHKIMLALLVMLHDQSVHIGVKPRQQRIEFARKFQILHDSFVEPFARNQ